jgi:hypothetical protein
MTDLVGQPASAKQRRRGASIGLVFALAALVILIVAAAAFVALVLWPRWPAATVTPDTPALPITVGGVLFNVPPGAIRVTLQRRPGAQERLDLAFLWPSLDSPNPNARPAPTENLPPIDRLFVTVEPQTSAMAPNDRLRVIYPRYLADTQFDGPDGLKVISFREGTPYHNEDLFFDPAAQPGFAVRCSRPGAAGMPGMCLYERRIEGADVTVRFPSEWLTGWPAVNQGIGRLMERLRPMP